MSETGLGRGRGAVKSGGMQSQPAGRLTGAAEVGLGPVSPHAFGAGGAGASSCLGLTGRRPGHRFILMFLGCAHAGIEEIAAQCRAVNVEGPAAFVQQDQRAAA